MPSLQQYILGEHPVPAQQLLTATQSLHSRVAALNSKLSTLPLPLTQALALIRTPVHQLRRQQASVAQHMKDMEIMGRFVEGYLEGRQREEPGDLAERVARLERLAAEGRRGAQGGGNWQGERMAEWTGRLRGRLEKKLGEFVIAGDSQLRVRVGEIQRYGHLLNEDTYRNFIATIYKDMLVYDVPTFSYILTLPSVPAHHADAITCTRSRICFPCQQSQSNFPQIQAAIHNTGHMASMLADSVPEQYRACIHAQINACRQDLRSQLEYILPYLKLSNRRELLALLTTKTQAQTTIYDVLVGLRLKGQDGDMMDHHVRMLVEKIRQEPGLLAEVLVFLEICESEEKSLNVGYYVCEELVRGLEGVVHYGEIEKLLELRQQIRFRIHHPIG